jgi:branched-chain amino acid transport system permease protein
LNVRIGEFEEYLMEAIFTLLIYTVLTGSVYGIIALGFSLVFGIAGVLNLMHGVYYMISGYFVYTFYMIFNDMITAVSLAIICTTVSGALSYIIIHPAIKSPFRTLLTTFAMGGAISEILFIIYGVTTYGIPNILPGGLLIFNVPVIKQAVFAAAVALTVFAIFIIFLNRSNIGRSMRAVAQNEDVARLCGIDIRVVKFTTFTIAAFLSGIAGALYLPLQSLNPGVWMNITVLSFVIVVLGGMGSLKGLLISAYIIAFVEYATVLSFAEGSYIKTGVYLLIMVLILMLRPQGLFGKNLGPLEVQV